MYVGLALVMTGAVLLGLLRRERHGVPMPILTAAAALLLVASTGAWADGAFDDDDGNVHEGYIEAIVDEGITAGCDTDRYCPADAVTRAQMATYVAMALGLVSHAEPERTFTYQVGSRGDAESRADLNIG